MDLDEIYQDLIEMIKDIDFSKVDSDGLKNDSLFESLTEKYKEIFNPGSRRTESEKDELKNEIVIATKNLIRTKYLIAEDKTVKITLSMCKNKLATSPLQDIEESMGLDLESHDDINVDTAFEYDPSKDEDGYMDTINIINFAKSHIMMVNGQATKMSGADVAYIMNNLKGKIIFLSGVTKDSPFNRYDIPFSEDEDNNLYKEVNNSGYSYKIFIHEKAKTVLFNSDGTPKISYVHYNDGYIFQWFGSPHFDDKRDMINIDETLYSILTMLIIRMNYVNKEGGGADLDGKLVISGSPADSKLVVKKQQSSRKDFEKNISYSENGYTGVLDKKGSPVIISGNYETGDSMTMSTTLTLTNIVSHDEDAFEKEIKYSKNGYTGTLKRKKIEWKESVDKRTSVSKNKTDTVTVKAQNLKQATSLAREQVSSSIDYTFKDPDTGKTINTKLNLKSLSCIKTEPIIDECKGFFYWMDKVSNSNKMTRKTPRYPESYYGERSGFSQKDVVSAAWAGRTEGPGNYISDKSIKNTYRRPVTLVYRKKVGTKFTFKVIWESSIEMPDYHTNVFKGIATYTGEVHKDENDDRIWEQTYEGLVSKPDDRVYGNAIDQQIEDIEDDPFSSYDIKKQLVKAETAKRHVIKINEIEGKKNKYQMDSYMQSIDLIEYVNKKVQGSISDNKIINNISAIGFFCNEYIPVHFPNRDSCIKYFMTVNGKQYEVLPVNSTRNGKKIIRTTEVESDSEYVIYLNEPIKSAYLSVTFNLPNNEETPFVSNFKVLIG